jgi:CheY-like chemotaxis protein
MGQDFTATCSAAISQVPDDGNDLGALYSAADAAIQRIQATGGNRSLQAGWKSPSHQPEPGHVDVALVATDEALGGLLMHALRVRGYTVERIEHGAEARRVLLGNDARVRSRLILLDSELDDGDGYDLLHDLQSTGASRQSRVMLLSNRSTESDVLRALELGAFEHVAKPFSLPILMQRVRRAVEAQA